MVEKYRKKIDKIDKKILKLLEERMKISNDIGNYKKNRKLCIEDKRREREIVESLGNKTKLDKGFIKKLYKIIFKFSKKVQR